MPIKIQSDLPAREVLENENVDLIISDRAVIQDIRPIKLLFLNLMPKKEETEIQFARLLGNSPLQIELTLMTTASYKPRNTEPGYLRRFYRSLDDVKDDYFDGIIITGAPVETLDFENVNYWQELVTIMEWSRHHCFRRLGICWGGQAMLYHFHHIQKHMIGHKQFGVFDHKLTETKSRLMKGFTDSFPMPVSRYTENRSEEINKHPYLEVLAESPDAGPGIVRHQDTGDLFVLNHLEYDADTLAAEYNRDQKEGLETPVPLNYFPDNNPAHAPINYWRPFAFLFITNWIHDLYQATPFDLTTLDQPKS
ncbi:MAG: homoserine O-succinyltransferase [Alphaproteobacteria bacterium]|nr:homoserine O-succinyltransferase [Alphaproteobacteria bacterium]